MYTENVFHIYKSEQKKKLIEHRVIYEIEKDDIEDN